MGTTRGAQQQQSLKRLNCSGSESTPATKAAAKGYTPKEVNPDVPVLALTQHDLEIKPGLVIVVDCKPLARVLNGQEALDIKIWHLFVLELPID